MPKATLVVKPHYGLYLGEPSVNIPAQGLEDCNNVRIRFGRLSSRNMGWTKFVNQTLSGPVTLLTEFVKLDGTRILLAGTPADLYRFDTVANKFLFINRRYTTGSASRSGSTVTGTGTAWVTVGIKPGDFIHFGSASQNDPDAAWHLITAVGSNTSLTTATSGTVANGPYTIRRTFTGDPAAKSNYWSSVTFPLADMTENPFQNFWFGVNGKDRVVYWDGVLPTVVEFAGAIDTCRVLRVFKNMLIYVAPTYTGTFLPGSVHSSDVGQPVQLTGGLAGLFTAVSGTSPIITADNLGDDLVLYTDNEVTSMAFVGSPVIFSFRTAIPDAGILGARSLANKGASHAYLARDGYHEFNGVSFDHINDHVWARLFQDRDHSRPDVPFATVNDELGEIYWAWARTSDSDVAPTYALVEHYQEVMPTAVPTPFTRRDFPFITSTTYQRTASLTWNQVAGKWTAQQFAWSDQFFSANFAQTLVGGYNGIVYVLNAADSQDGTPYASYALFPRRLLADGSQRALVKRVHVYADEIEGADYDLVVTTTVFDQIGQATGSSTIQSFNLDAAGRHYVAPFRRGRFAQVQFGTPGAVTGQPWELNGYDLEVVAGGRA